MASADNTSTLDIDKALDVASQRMVYESLFPKQREAVEAFISGRAVFVCLPTSKGGGTTGARGALAPLMLWPYNTDCLLK